MNDSVQFAGGADYVKAYIYNNEGYSSPAIRIPNNPLQIASFIVKAKSARRVIIKDYLDKSQIEASNGFILSCPNQEYMKERLMPVLTPLQLDEYKKKPAVNILEVEVGEGAIGEEILKFIKTNFGIQF